MFQMYLEDDDECVKRDADRFTMLDLVASGRAVKSQPTTKDTGHLHINTTSGDDSSGVDDSAWPDAIRSIPEQLPVPSPGPLEIPPRRQLLEQPTLIQRSHINCECATTVGVAGE